MLVLLAMAIVACRKFDALANPQFWAEDGAEFFIQADLSGWRSLFMPYAGYYHLVPRLIALASAGLPAAWVPAIYSYVSWAAIGLLVVHTCSARLALPAKPWLALAAVLVAHNNEVFLCLANLQWPLALVLIQVLCFEEPVTTGQRVRDGMTVVLLGLTGPFVIFFLPLFALRAWRRRTYFSWALAGTAALAATIQLCSLAAQAPTGEPGGLPGVFFPLWLAVRSIDGAFLGLRLSAQLSPSLAIAAAAVLLAGLGALLRLDRAHRSTQWMFGLALTLLLAAVAFKFRHQPTQLSGFENGERYFYVPRVLLLWLAALATIAPGWRGRAAQAFLAAGLLAGLARFISPALPDLDWPAQARQLDQGGPTLLRLNPGPMELRHWRHRR